MTDTPKLMGTDTLRQAYPKINQSIDRVNNFKSQIDQMVIEGDSSVEAAQARVKADGTVKTTLKDRLDESDAQLTQILQNNVLKRGAKGDGITNDSSVVQMVIDEVYTNGGGKVILPLTPNGYRLHNVVVKDGVSLVGDNLAPYRAIDKVTKILPIGTTGATLIVHNQTALDGIVFYNPEQKYSLATDSESFNPTPTAIQIGSADKTIIKGFKLNNVGVVGYLDFVVQHPSVINVEGINVDGVYGMPLRTGFEINVAYDIPTFNNISFNLNSYRDSNNISLITGTVSNYYYKVAASVTVFKIGRVDDIFGNNLFAFGVRRFIHFRKNAFIGDNGSGGGFTFSNVSVDACHEAVLIERSNMNFNLKWNGGFVVPNIKISGSTQAVIKFVGDAENNKVIGSTLKFFGSTASIFGDSSKSGSANHFVVWETTGQLNTVTIASLSVAEFLINIVSGADVQKRNHYSFPGLIRNHDSVARAEQDGSLSLLGGMELGIGKGLTTVSATGTKRALTTLDDGMPYWETGRLTQRVGVPTSATANGLSGQWAADNTHFYVCTATNVWRRVAVGTW